MASLTCSHPVPSNWVFLEPSISTYRDRDREIALYVSNDTMTEESDDRCAASNQRDVRTVRIHRNRILHLFTILFVRVLMLPRYILAQDIVALSAYQDHDGVSFTGSTTQQIYLDAANLGIGRDFYDRPSIQLQLSSDGPIKTFNLSLIHI